MPSNYYLPTLLNLQVIWTVTYQINRSRRLAAISDIVYSMHNALNVEKIFSNS